VGHSFGCFDPISDQLPYWPNYQSSHGILWRARLFVRNRTREELENIAREADSMIEAFFDSEHDRLENIIRRDGRVDLFEDGENYSSGIRSDAYDEFDIRNRENTCALDALAEAIETICSGSFLLDVSDWEYFACFALSRLDDFVKELSFKYDHRSGHLKRVPKNYSAVDIRTAAFCLIEAQDAVGRAELIRAKEDLSSQYEKKIDNLKKHGQDTETNAQIIADQVRADLLEQDTRRRKEQSAARNNVRHEQNREIKSRVLGIFAADPSKFPSAERAAKHFCGMLAKEGIEREQRTVAEWIRAYAKDRGLRWRA
jgi:hypothetical protein